MYMYFVHVHAYTHVHVHVHTYIHVHLHNVSSLSDTMALPHPLVFLSHHLILILMLIELHCFATLLTKHDVPLMHFSTFHILSWGNTPSMYMYMYICTHVHVNEYIHVN